MQSNETNRREFLTRLGIGALTVGAVSALAACGKKEGVDAAVACNDISGLSEGEKATRESLKYVDASPDASKLCKGCQQFVEPAAGAACGGCKIIKGPIAAPGYCTAFVPKAA